MLLSVFMLLSQNGSASLTESDGANGWILR